MSLKNVYLYKMVIRDTATNMEVPVSLFKTLFDEIFNRECLNNAIRLTIDSDPEVIMFDILEETDEYLFARLNRKRPNNALQKRDYTSNLIEDVLQPDEVASNGVEAFTYCILGYSHGILSIVNSKSAPGENALSRIFGRFNNRYVLETHSIPNNELIRELLNGEAPEINKVQVEIAQPDAQIMERLFGFDDSEILQSVGENTSCLVFEVKPEFRRALASDPTIVTRLIQAFRQNRARYKSVVLSGKKSPKERRREYDLYEEYFKYPITVKEYRTEGGRQVELPKDVILHDYRNQMMNIYNEYKDIVLAVSNR